MKSLSFQMMFLTLFFSGNLFAQNNSMPVKDTLRINIEEAEKIFLEKNYRLLAQKYNVDIAKSAIKQAGLWINPTFFYETVLYNPGTGKAFDYNAPNQGEYVVQVQKMVQLGGKRSKLVQLAETNKELEQLAFEDLLRILRLELYDNYINLYSNIKKLALLKTESDKLGKMMQMFKLEYSEGAIAGYELTRIQFEAQSIQVTINSLVNELINDQMTIRLMLGMSESKFVLPTTLPTSDAAAYTYQAIVDSAKSNRPDLKASIVSVRYQEQSIRLEKAKSIPNMVLGYNFDKYGNAFSNYHGVNVAFELPVFNRNQGNIKIAEIQAESAKKNSQNAELIVLQEVDAAYDQLTNIQNLYNSIDSTYVRNLSKISNEALKKYNERSIGLLDFLDKIRTYKNGQINLIDMEKQYFSSRKYFNYVTNSKFYN